MLRGLGGASWAGEATLVFITLGGSEGRGAERDTPATSPNEEEKAAQTEAARLRWGRRHPGGGL